MISKIITFLVLAGVGLAIWQATGGNQQDFFSGVWSVFYAIVSFIASAVTTAWHTVFTVK
jgi:hypothetical protein